MIGAGLSYYRRKTAQNPLDGNAQVFDGTFDYDVLSNWNQLDSNEPFSIMMELNITALPSLAYFFTQGVTSGLGGFYVLSATRTFVVRLVKSVSPSNRIEAVYNSFTTVGRQNIIITYDGSLDASGLKLYKNGSFIPKSSNVNTLTDSIISPSTDLKIGARTGTGQLLNGIVKTFEILNREATPTEIADGSVSGSFRGAGISFNSGDYRLAIDFNKEDGQDPTTFAGTPPYTITAFGGSTYEPYL